MAKNFHEQFSAEEVPLPSDRSTGFVFAGVAVVVAVLFRANTVVMASALAVAVVFAAVSLLAPSVLRPLNILWMRFALLLSRVVSPVVMLVLFAITIVPFGLVMQLRYDPLRKRRKPDAASYWIERDHSGPSSSMTNQF